MRLRVGARNDKAGSNDEAEIKKGRLVESSLFVVILWAGAGLDCGSSPQ